jgi:hypothetical protein
VDANGNLPALLNGVLVGVGTVYVATGSVLVTIAAAVAAVIMGSLAPRHRADKPER